MVAINSTAAPLRVLVTGGEGFIGSALCRRLHGDGHAVVSLDRVSGGRLAASDAGAGLRLVRGDVRDEGLVASLIAEADAVVHLAAVAGVQRYMDDPEEVLDVNIGGSRTVARTCCERGVPLLLVSTSEVYGHNHDDLSEGSARVLGSGDSRRWCYALSKAVAEEYAAALAMRGLRCAIARPFNVYGPDLDAPGEGRIIAHFLGRLRAGRPLELVDGGEAVRCFCYIDDAVEALTRMLADLHLGRRAGRAYNIGRREPVTMRALAELMLDLSGRPVGTVVVSGAAFYGAGYADTLRRVPDLTAMHAELGVEATVSLRDGLARVLRRWDLLAPP